MRQLAARGVSVRFGEVNALDDVSLALEAGHAQMLVGPNGAGKSTLIKVLLGLVRPDFATFERDGERVAIDNAWKERIGYLPEAVGFSENLSGRQLLRFFARARGVRTSRVDEVLERVGLSHAGKRAIRGYSRGMRQRLGLGVAILSGPELLVLDEPTSGLDQEGLTVLWSVIDEWRESGRAVLASSHDLALMERHVDTICVLRAGRVLALGSAGELRGAAGLPHRISLDVDDPADARVRLLSAAIEKWAQQRVDLRDDRLVVDVPGDAVLELMKIQAGFPGLVTGVRVEEPTLDLVYDKLLNEGAAGGGAHGGSQGSRLMGRVGRALVWHELIERTRDRWVVVVSVLFALLASAVGLYGRGAEAEVARLTGPSLVTLASLLVPLVALVLSHDAITGERERNTLGLLFSLPVGRLEVVVAKFLGRSLALALAVGLGLGAALVVSDPGSASALLALMFPTLLLGLAFLSLGLLISASVRRQTTAASLVVVVWFGLVFFYDLGLLALLVITDGGVSQQAVSSLVLANPAGLYRVQMMNVFAGPEVMEDLGLETGLPAAAATWAIWAAWLAVPVLISGAVLSRRKVA